MNLTNTVTIPAAPQEAWRLLLDVERIAHCVPGAVLTGSDGDRHEGRIKVKLGAIGLTYTGTVTFLSRDEQAMVVVLEASGRESRGSGTAKALVTCRLTDADGGGTDMCAETRLTITGKPAQFGRGALAEVSTALMTRFAENLAAQLGAEPPPARRTERQGGTGESRPPAAVAAPVPAAPLDLVEASTAVRWLAAAAVAAAGFLLALGLRGRRRHRD
ncbi:SRPBCC family protein [Streptomyces sp. JW3]|uniref:SRPBCC family protein n=1 Tax=Streptomyces sp. JW3 TaxID=3456955 RepID=UPI003FA48504